MDKTKTCKVCGKEFQPKFRTQLSCSWDCRQDTIRKRARQHSRLKRRVDKKKYKPCVICGFKVATKPCYQGGKQYILCPNHRALIIQEGKTIEELSK